MINVDIRPVWMLSTETQPPREINILGLLQGIADTGKLTQAARQSGLSYRHAWTLLDQWADYLGSPLVEKQQGRGVTLTALGEALLWAEKRVNARLTAQLTNLSSELEVALNRAINDTKQVIRLHASHGYAVAELRELLHKSTQVQLDLQYRGSKEALIDLSRGDCDIAGFHIPEGPLEQEAVHRFAKWLDAADNRIIHFVRRSQGLILQKGNPHQITGLGDLTRSGLRFVNREPSSGTRMLLDMLLKTAGVNSASIPGYEKEELTHNAVAALIASGMADAGFGVEAAARQFDLGFIPIATEQYYLMCHQDLLAHPGMASILGLLRSDAFKRTIVAIPGYTAPRSGEVSTIPETFPQSLSKD